MRENSLNSDFLPYVVIHENVILSASIIHLVACILLIVSVTLQKSILAIPWLVETLFVLVAGIVYSIFLMSLTDRLWSSDTPSKTTLSYDEVYFAIISGAVLLLICGNYIFFKYLLSLLIFCFTFFCYIILIGLHAHFWVKVFHFHRELEFVEENRKKAEESNENRMMSVIASGQSSLPSQNQATTQDPKVVTIYQPE